MHRTLAALDAEWERLGRSPVARRAVAGWAAAHPDLTPYGDLHQLLEARRDPAVAPSILRALAALAPSDDLAARALLQAMLPGLIRIPGPADGSDAIDCLVGLAWERIRTYPTTRTGSVAANILLDVRKQYVRQRVAERGDAWPRLRPDAAAVRSPEDVVIELDLVRELDRARRRGLISAPEFRAIVRTRIVCDSPAEAAAQEDVTVRCLLKRRWRGERSIRATVPLAG